MKKNLIIWYAVALLLLLCLCNKKTKAQTYIRASFGSKSSFSVSLQTKAESIKYLEYGFGISAFTNEGKKGMDYTNFYNPNSPDVYEVVASQNASIFLLGGRHFDNGFAAMAKLGLGARKWYHNGKTNGELWYVTRDGGTYLLYGIEASRALNKILAAVGYDNFNGFLLTLGFKIN